MSFNKVYLFHWVCIVILIIFIVFDCAYVLLNNPIQYCIGNGDINSVTKWIESNPQKRVRVKLAPYLALAASKNDLNMVKIILGAKISPDSYDFEMKTALYYAVLNQNEELAKLLLDMGANPHTKLDLFTAYQLAFRNEVLPILVLFVDHGYLPDKTYIKRIDNPDLKKVILKHIGEVK